MIVRIKHGELKYAFPGQTTQLLERIRIGGFPLGELLGRDSTEGALIADVHIINGINSASDHQLVADAVEGQVEALVEDNLTAFEIKTVSCVKVVVHDGSARCDELRGFGRSEIYPAWRDPVAGSVPKFRRQALDSVRSLPMLFP